MSDVSCVCCAPLVAEVRARGLEPRRLVEGIPITLSQLENPLRRVPWEPFREFARRAGELLGGPEELEEVAARAAPEAVPRLLRRLLPLLGSARAIYPIGARWWGPWVFRGTHATCEALADGRLREIIEILPGYGECPEFFQGLRGVLRSMPRLFGQPDAVVDLSQDGRRAEYVIATAPPPRHWVGARRRASVSTLPEELEELGFRQEQLRDALRRSRAAAALLSERTRRLETVHRLGVELVWHRDTRTRIEGMIRLLRDLLPLRGIRIGYDGSEGGRPSIFAGSGELSAPPSTVRRLQVAGRPVGHLELWPRDLQGLAPEDEALLEEFLPWLALALDTARTDDQMQALRAQLEEDLADWHRAELRLERLLERASPTGPGPEEERVLVVEAEGKRRAAARRTLEAAGYRVVEAASLAEAMAICDVASEPIELLMTDCARPAFDLEAARRAMEEHPGLRGVLLLRLQRP